MIGQAVVTGRHRPEYGPDVYDVTCSECKATWCGEAGEMCGWCADREADAAKEQSVLDRRHPKERVELWPEPVPLVGARSVPPFPVETLPRAMAEHALAVAERVQVPVDLCAQMGLGVLAALAMTKATVAVNGSWSEPLMLWTATALPSGAGKSPAAKRMTAPLVELEQQWCDDAEPEIQRKRKERQIAERRLKTIEEKAAKGEAGMGEVMAALDDVNAVELVPDPRLLADDATPEALVGLLSEHGGRIAIVSSEAEVLDMACGQYAAGRQVNLSVYLKGHSGEPIIVDRVGGENRPGRRVRVPAAHLTIAVTVQPSALASLAKAPQLAGRGFTARFMYAIPEDRRGARDQSSILDDTEIPTTDEYRGFVLAFALALAGPERKLRFDRPALERFADWLTELEPRLAPGADLSPVGEWVAKCKSSVVRVAGLLHLADRRRGDSVALADVERAIAIGEFWIEHALAVADLWGQTDERRVALLLLRWLQKWPKATFDTRDAHRAVYSSVDSVDQIHHGLRLLVESGWVREVSREKTRNGRDSVTYEPRPATGATESRESRQSRKRGILNSLSPQLTPSPYIPPATGATGATGEPDDPPATESGETRPAVTLTPEESF